MRYAFRAMGTPLFNYLRVFTKDFTLYGIYRSNQSLWKTQDIASINCDCFTTDESNQVKISREIMQCQGYFLKLLYGKGWSAVSLSCQTFH